MSNRMPCFSEAPGFYDQLTGYYDQLTNTSCGIVLQPRAVYARIRKESINSENSTGCCSWAPVALKFREHQYRCITLQECMKARTTRVNSAFQRVRDDDDKCSQDFPLPSSPIVGQSTSVHKCKTIIVILNYYWDYKVVGSNSPENKVYLLLVFLGCQVCKVEVKGTGTRIIAI